MANEIVNDVFKVDVDSKQLERVFQNLAKNVFHRKKVREILFNQKSTSWFYSQASKVQTMAKSLAPDGNFGNWKRKSNRRKLIDAIEVFEVSKNNTTEAFRKVNVGINWTKYDRKTRGTYAAILVGKRKKKTGFLISRFKYTKPEARRYAISYSYEQVYGKKDGNALYIEKVFLPEFYKNAKKEGF